MRPKDNARLWLNIFLAFAVMNFFVGFFCGKSKVDEKTPLIIGDANEPALVIEVVLWLQDEVGARRDGIIGPETSALVNAQSKLDEPIYFNKLAARYFTASGAPRKE